MHLMKKTVFTNEADWLNARASTLGASEASAVIGENRWCTNVQMWELKTSRRQPEDLSGNSAVQYGKNAEEHIRGLFRLSYADEYELHYDGPYTLYRSRMNEWCTCTPDGLLIEKATGVRGHWECKTRDARQNPRAWSEWDGQVPRQYFVQGLHQLHVLESEFMIFTVLIRGNGMESLRHFRFDRDEFLQGQIDDLIREESAFMEHVKNGTPPPLKMWI